MTESLSALFEFFNISSIGIADKLTELKLDSIIEQGRILLFDTIAANQRHTVLANNMQGFVTADNIFGGRQSGCRIKISFSL